MAISRAQARVAKDAAKAELAGIPGVVGIGLTKIGGDYALKVNLQSTLPRGVEVPAQIRGVPVQVEVVGRIRPR